MFLLLYKLCSCYNDGMQPNSNWQPDQNPGNIPGQPGVQPDSGLTSQQVVDQYGAQTLQQIDDSVRDANQYAYDSYVEDAQPVEVGIQEGEEVDWQAEEYISSEKNTAWYIGLGVVVVAVILLDIFFMKSISVSVLIVVIAVVIIVMSIRPARMIQYRMNSDGLFIDDQFIKFSEYKAFGVFREHGRDSVLLIPVKRFMPGMYIYFPEGSREDIVGLLSSKLPVQEVKPDFMDRIVKLLRL